MRYIPSVVRLTALSYLFGAAALAHDLTNMPHPLGLEVLTQMLRNLNVEPTEPIVETPQTYRVVGRMGNDAVILVVDRLTAEVRNERARTSLMRVDKYKPSTGSDFANRAKKEGLTFRPETFSSPIAVSPKHSVIKKAERQEDPRPP